MQSLQDPGKPAAGRAIRRPRDTPIWKLEAALKCRSCWKGRYAPPMHMIKLTATQRRRRLMADWAALCRSDGENVDAVDGLGISNCAIVRDFFIGCAISPVVYPQGS